MKYAVVMFVCCVLALAAAAPQFITAFSPYGATYGAPFSRTLVAGPTVYNGAFGARYIAPGYVGPAIF